MLQITKIQKHKSGKCVIPRIQAKVVGLNLITGKSGTKLIDRPITERGYDKSNFNCFEAKQTASNAIVNGI